MVAVLAPLEWATAGSVIWLRLSRTFVVNVLPDGSISLFGQFERIADETTSQKFLSGLIFTLLLAALLGMSPFKAFAEVVSVRAGAHPDYGRLVFDWPVAVRHCANVRNRMLIVRFNKPIEPSFGRVTRVLRDYVSAIRVAADGKTIVAPLREQFAARTSVAGNRVIVDLYPDENVERPSIKPKNVAARKSNTRLNPIRLGPKSKRRTAASAATKSATPTKLKETLKVRTGHFKNYGRLIFDWPKKVGFTVDRKGRAVSIQFNAPIKIDVPALRRQLPSQISAAISRSRREGLELSLVVAPGSQLRYFHNGPAVVFDVVAPGKVRRVVSKEGSTSGAAKPKRNTGVKRKNSKKKTRPRALALISVDAARRGTETAIRFN